MFFDDSFIFFFESIFPACEEYLIENNNDF